MHHVPGNNERATNLTTRRAWAVIVPDDPPEVIPAAEAAAQRSGGPEGNLGPPSFHSDGMALTRGDRTMS